jgi:hypothetical protein
VTYTAVNVFELFAKIGLDTKEYEENLGKSESKFKSFGKALGNGLKTAAKVGTAAIGTASAGIVALTKQAVESYAEYEQLVGGVETLFKDNADTVQKYADEAYKTAGMSANDYMATVTGFSASLLQSLDGDTKAAADKANQAIIDMSDNANKMGSDLETLKTAYAGFSKGQFMLLDNLKLGYGGTQEEMKRLLADAEKISGIKYDISSYADIVDPIHVVQTEMGITGTTAKEASETIAGSTSAMKSAWQNLITGIADDNADFGQLIDNFVESVGVAAGNILPRIETALGGVSNLIGELFPVIMQKIPDIIETTLPTIAQSAVKIIESFLAGIEQNPDQIVNTIMMVMDILIDSIVDMLPDIIVVGALLLGKLAVGIVEAIPDLVGKIPQIVTEIVDCFGAKAEEFKSIGTNIVKGLWEGIKAMGSWLKEKIFGWLDDLIGDVKENEEIHSPSKKWGREIGKPDGQGVGVGFIDGLEESEKLIQKEIDGMSANITTDINATHSSASVLNGQSSEVAELLYRLIDLFKTGKAKTNISNARELRGVSYG